MYTEAHFPMCNCQDVALILKNLYSCPWLAHQVANSCKFTSLHSLPSPILHNPSQSQHFPLLCNVPGNALLKMVLVKDGRNGLQEDLNLAAKEYKRSGIHAKVNKLIQEAFQNHGDDVEILCPILVKIAQQNQLCKILFPYALPILTTAPSKDAVWEGLTEAPFISLLFHP
ncbi:hypothetical protein BKA83DRAFT_4124388 [Pisolithus microcarpus]|nr:hypothetical protein BKA83DRAFT_4124388 [Pisolithus microcarpus]